jgi:hypothetical protein
MKRIRRTESSQLPAGWKRLHAIPLCSWIFIEVDKHMHAEGKGLPPRRRYRVGVPENDPQPDPSNCETHVDRVPHVAVETPLTLIASLSDRHRSSVSRPTPKRSLKQPHMNSRPCSTDARAEPLT